MKHLGRLVSKTCEKHHRSIYDLPFMAKRSYSLAGDLSPSNVENAEQ